MEPTPSPVLAKKLWSIVRIVILMMRKGISKRKLMVDLHLMMKRGKIAGKAIGNLMFHHHHYHNYMSNLSCKSQDPNLAFINPSIRDYEFSCSNSPAFPSLYVSKNRKHHNHYNSYYRHHNKHGAYHGGGTAVNDITTASAVKKVLEMLNNEVTTDASPVVPGFGYGRNSPFVRQLRITDSPFPLKNNDDEDCHVDEEAEEFIEKFYKQLRLQN